MPALAQLLRAAHGAPFEPRAACAIVRRVCDQLDRPHGDLAPSAIHVSWTGGVTMPVRARPPASVLAYMAPERLAGGPPQPRADVYSLAIVLCEMITGGPVPRDALERAARARQLLLEHDAPVELVDVIERATSRDPHVRHASPREMAAWLTLAEEESGGAMSDDDLADWLARRFPRGAPAATASAPTPVPPSASLRPARRPILVGAAAAATLCAAAVGVAAAVPGLTEPSHAAQPALVEAGADRVATHPAPARSEPGELAASPAHRSAAMPAADATAMSAASRRVAVEKPAAGAVEAADRAVAAAAARRREARRRARAARAARQSSPDAADPATVAQPRPAGEGAACPMRMSARSSSDRSSGTAPAPPATAAPAGEGL